MGRSCGQSGSGGPRRRRSRLPQVIEGPESAISTRFPQVRMRRLRGGPTIRRMVRADAPVAGPADPARSSPSRAATPSTPSPSLPGQSHLSPDLIARTARRAYAAGVPAVLLFGVTGHKDGAASAAFDPAGVVQTAVAADQGRRARDGRGDRRLPVRLHRPRPLRRAGGRRGPQRPEPRGAGAGGREPRRGRRRHRGAQRHDGRAGRRDPRGARRRGPRGHVDPGLLRQVRLGASTAPSARPPARRPARATGAGTRWTRPTAARACARRCSTPPRARTCSWSSRPPPTST